MNDHNDYKAFYENIDRENLYTPATQPENHSAYKLITNFVEKYDLTKKKCLEIGSSKGVFQNIVTDYTGLDIAESLEKYYSKPYYKINDDGTYPFEDNTFDAIWTNAVHEHIPDLNQALLELVRVLKPGGIVLFKPAWQCRPWAAQGYSVRPYSDFNLIGKIIKASIPVRDSLIFRSIHLFPKRMLMHFLFLLGKKFTQMRHNKLIPNYNVFWESDSDAINSIDPHDAILWFASKNFTCLSHPLHIKAFFIRNSALILRKN